MKKLTLLFLLSLILAVPVLAQEKSEKTKEETPAVDTTKINWLKYDEGLTRAKENDKKILINFTTAWCGYCKKMKREVFSQTETIKLINENFVPIIVDGDSKDELDIDGYKISERNLTKSEYHVTGYPTYWILKPNAERLAPIKGYRPKDTFLDMLSYIKDDLYQKMSFDEFLAAGGRNGNQDK